MLLTKPTEVTIGADPEVFLCNNKGLVMPACGLIGGTKESPVPVEGGALQEDNVMAEFNVNPSSQAESFVNNINLVYSEIVRKAEQVGLEVSPLASARFPMFILAEHPQAMEFGCEPDYNAYTLSENDTPSVHSTLRTCAGHIHLGYEEEGDPDYTTLVSYLDWYVGCWTVLHDPDKDRRERYGKAGAFRPKSYGLEYRVPSNFWLQSDKLKRAMFYRVQHAYAMAQAGTKVPNVDSVITAINTHDTEACIALLKEAA